MGPSSQTAVRDANTPQAFIAPPSLWRALSTLIGQAWPPESDDEVAAFVRAAEEHRLLAIAADDPALPACVRGAIGARYDVVARADASMDREADELMAMLPGVLSSDWLAINGSDFRRRLYPSSRLRSMYDVDILVRPEEVPAIVQRLLSLGFTKKPPVAGNRDIGLYPPARAGKPWDLWLDLYVGLVDASRADIDDEEIWRARELGSDGIPRMARPHALAAHALLIANMQFVTHMRKVLDLWLLTRDADAVRGAVDCARRWNIKRSLYGSFALMRRLFPESAADPWNADVDALLDARERASLDRMVATGAPFDRFPPRPLMVWRKLSLLDSPAHRTRFLATHAGKVARRLGAVVSPGRS